MGAISSIVEKPRRPVPVFHVPGSVVLPAPAGVGSFNCPCTHTGIEQKPSVILGNCILGFLLFVGMPLRKDAHAVSGSSWVRRVGFGVWWPTQILVDVVTSSWAFRKPRLHVSILKLRLQSESSLDPPVLGSRQLASFNLYGVLKGVGGGGGSPPTP